MAIWQETFDDLRLKSICAKVDELRRLEEIFDQLNPGEIEKWNQLVVKVYATTDESEKRAILEQLNECPYYKVVGKDLIKARSDRAALRYLKSLKFTVT